METIWVTCNSCRREFKVEWDVKEDGYAVECPRCHSRNLLCSECLKVGNHRCDKERSGRRCKRNRRGYSICSGHWDDEAADRIRGLTLNLDMRNSYVTSKTLWYSDGGDYSGCLHREDAERIYDIEDKFDIKVYYVIRTGAGASAVDYCLFAGRNEFQWDKNWIEFDEKYVTVYMDDHEHPERNCFKKIHVVTTYNVIKKDPAYPDE